MQVEDIREFDTYEDGQYSSQKQFYIEIGFEN